MDQTLKDKISEALNTSFVGGYIFTDTELSLIYDEVSKIFRNIACERGETISPFYFEQIFVALVNLAKEWAPEEEAFLNFVNRRLLGTESCNGKIYNQIVNIIQNLNAKNKIFLFKSYKKKFYATLCSHAFSPLSSTYAFLDMCWEIYCKDLDQQYFKNDKTFEIIADSLKNKFLANKNEEDNFIIGSKSYAIRAGIRGLALDEKEKLLELLDLTISTVNSLFNNEIILYDNYYKQLIKKWWNKKEQEFGTNKDKVILKKDIVIQDYSQINPRYVLNNDSTTLYIPPIRLKEHFEFEPYIEIKIDNTVVISEPLKLRGSGIVMTTLAKEFDISQFDSLNISVEITHCNNQVYNSKQLLQREFILFNANGKEITMSECIPNTYFLYIQNFNNLLQYPENIERTKPLNTYSINALDGDIIQTKIKTIFFLSEKTDREVIFVFNKLGNADYKKNGENYCIIDGELYVELADNTNASNYGVKLGSVNFKLIDFNAININEKSRYCISSLLNEGETQHISIFRYLDNKIIANIELIKFNNISIRYNKEIYYGKAEEAFVEFSSDTHNIKQSFVTNDEEVLIPFNNGFIVTNPPLLKWKIDDGEWATNFSEKALWYKDITNTSTLHIEIPKDKKIDIEMNNVNVEKNANKLSFKFGEMLYRCKDSICENIYNVIAKIESTNSYPLFNIYTKECFIDSPIEVNAYKHKIAWEPIFFVGDKDAKFKFKIENKKEVFCEMGVSLDKKIFDCKNLPEGYYTVSIMLTKKSFLEKEIELLKKTIILGNEKRFKYEDKILVINGAILFGKTHAMPILPVYAESIKYLGKIDCYDYYSAILYLINKEGHKIFLTHMKKDDGRWIKINPIRIEFKSHTTCYIGYDLDINDLTNFEYNDEFSLNKNRITIGTKTHGIRNNAIDYFKYEVKNV